MMYQTKAIKAIKQEPAIKNFPSTRLSIPQWPPKTPGAKAEVGILTAGEQIEVIVKQRAVSSHRSYTEHTRRHAHTHTRARSHVLVSLYTSLPYTYIYSVRTLHWADLNGVFSFGLCAHQNICFTHSCLAGG